MTVGNRHERLKSVLAQLVRVYLEETGGRYSGSGAVTVSRADQARGVEPDESFYIRNVDRVVGTRELDFSTDPPPDLVIEIEVSRSVDVRLPVMAAFRVPEVWRCDGTRLTVLVLRPDGAYAESDRSSAVPGFPLGEVGRYLALAETTDEGTVSREFRAWVRAHLPAAPNA